MPPLEVITFTISSIPPNPLNTQFPIDNWTKLVILSPKKDGGWIKRKTQRLILHGILEDCCENINYEVTVRRVFLEGFLWGHDQPTQVSLPLQSKTLSRGFLRCYGPTFSILGCMVHGPFDHHNHNKFEGGWQPVVIGNRHQRTHEWELGDSNQDQSFIGLKHCR